MNSEFPKKDIIYVFIQLLFFVLYFLPVAAKSDTDHGLYLKMAGLLIAVSGGIVLCFSLLQLKTNLTPFPSPKVSGTLVQSGLYKFVRHPIYTGILLLALGISIYYFSGWKFAITVALQMLFYFKSGYEEMLLLHKYKDYKIYKKNTGRFFPVLFRT